MPFTCPDPRLVYDFDPEAVLEALINGRWRKVAANEFRSWSGPRRIDGERYCGVRYYYLSNDTYTGVTAD